MSLLLVDNVSFAYPGCGNTLDSITLAVDEGEMVVLLGPNGAGKSTLLKCIMNLLAPQSGRVLIDGHDANALSRKDIAQIIAYVPQSSNVSFSYSVRDYVAMGRAPFLKMYAAPNDDDYRKVDAALERLGVAALAHRAYDELSGGQQQLVNVARAIAQDPRLILFDEPTSALDYGNQVKVLEMVKDLSREGYSIVMTTHNPDHPILLDSSVCLIDGEGSLVKGSVDEIMQEEELERVYHAKILIRYVGTQSVACA